MKFVKVALVLFAILADNPSDAGALTRWKGKLQDQSTELCLWWKPPTFFQWIYDSVGNFAAGILHSVGSILPLRGVASLAADIGIPGAASVMDVLTPRTALPRSRVSLSSTNHRTVSGRRNLQLGNSPLRAEIQSIVGAVHGEQECVLKLACLSGKRLSVLPGFSTLAMLLTTATNVMPALLREPYNALKNSVLYSDDCTQYACIRNNHSDDF